MWNITDIKQFYEQLKENGPYAVFAPQYKGGSKSQYIATVFNESILPYFENSYHDKILDFGCGTGVLSNRLAHTTYLTVGVDVSPAVLEIAKKGGLGSKRKAIYLQIDGEKLPFGRRRFNSVIARESLCHVSDENFPIVLSEINEVLCNNGHFYLFEQVSESSYWRTQADLTIRRSVSEIMEKTKSTGFKCIEAHVVRKPRFFLVYLFWFRLLPKVLMRPFAIFEINFNKHFFNVKTKRWHDAIFVFQKVSS